MCKAIHHRDTENTEGARRLESLCPNVQLFPGDLFLLESRVNGSFQSFVSSLSNQTTVDKDRGCSGNAVLEAISQIALHFVSELTRVKRLIETLAVKRELAGVGFQLIQTERGLVLHQQRGVLPVLPLLARRFGSFGGFESVPVLLQRKIADDQSHFIFVLVEQSLKHRRSRRAA